MRILLSVVLLPQAAVPVVVEDTVAQLVLPQELPDVAVGPVEYGEDTRELGPALATWANRREILRVRVRASISHDDSCHALLLDQPLDLGLEV